MNDISDVWRVVPAGFRFRIDGRDYVKVKSNGMIEFEDMVLRLGDGAILHYSEMTIDVQVMIDSLKYHCLDLAESIPELAEFA